MLPAGGGQATRRFAGNRVNQSEQSIDGITVSNGFDGTLISPLVSYIESFQEVRVDMANNTAAQRGSGVTHQPGGTAGGPIVIPRVYDGHDRSFFFFSLDTSRGSNILQLLNPTVPPASWRAGDFSRVSTSIRDPFNNNQPFAGNRIPEAQINPVSRRIQERFYPRPNFGDPNVLTPQNYREQKSRPFDPQTYYTARVDHRFSARSFLFGRWTWAREHSRAYEGNLPSIGRRGQTRDTRALNVSYTQSPPVHLQGGDFCCCSTAKPATANTWSRCRRRSPTCDGLCCRRRPPPARYGRGSSPAIRSWPVFTS